MLVVSWNDVIERIAIIGHQVALLTITVELNLGCVNFVNGYQVVLTIDLDSDLILVVLSGCNLCIGRELGGRCS